MLEVLARIRHRRTRRQLSPYVDGKLSAQESRRLEEHLAQCRACRDELEELRATVQAMAELPLVEAPRSFALTAAPRRVEALRPAARRLEFGLRAATVAAAFVLAIVAVGDLLGLPGGGEEGNGATVRTMQTAAREAGAPEEAPAPGQVQPSEAAEDKAVTEAPTAPAPATGVQGSTPSLLGGYGEGGQATTATPEPPAGLGGSPEEPVPAQAEAPTPAATAAPAATATPAAIAPPATGPGPAETPEPVTIGPAGLVYVVQPGDTLTALSERFGLSPETIAAANGIAESQPLLAEQKLVIPGAVYHVQPGDTLADIAADFGVPEAVIETANGIAAPGAIGPGQPLAIPGGGALPATQAPSPTAEQPRPTPTAPAVTATPAPVGAQVSPSEPEGQPSLGADERAPAGAEREAPTAEEGGPSRETVVRWLEIGLASGLALLFISWILARRRGWA